MIAFSWRWKKSKSHFVLDLDVYDPRVDIDVDVEHKEMNLSSIEEVKEYLMLECEFDFMLQIVVKAI